MNCPLARDFLIIKNHAKSFDSYKKEYTSLDQFMKDRPEGAVLPSPKLVTRRQAQDAPKTTLARSLVRGKSAGCPSFLLQGRGGEPTL